MKTVKVFVASSEELRVERNEFSDLVLQLNDLFERRGIQIKLIRWEHLDASMSAVHKQQEYNDKLRQSDICLVLYWTKFGEYTKTELDVAYEELKAGRNPQKIYVYFKEADALTPELKEFKESFATDYGHFFCRFENVDTMRLNFLLQFEASQNTSAQNRILKVENQKVKVDGQELVNLDNVPFAALNKEYQRLKADILELNEEIAELRAEQQSGSAKAEGRLMTKLSKRNRLEEEFEQHQNFLFDFSLELTKLSGTLSTERVAKAMELFEQGKASEANAVLDLDEMSRDAQRNLRDWEQGERLQQQRRDTLVADINGFLAKTKSAMADESLPIPERFAQTSQAYDSAIELAEKIDYDQGLMAQIIFDYAHLCGEFKKFDKAIDLYENVLSLKRNLAASNPDAHMSDISAILNNQGILHSNINNYTDAERKYSEALNIRRSLPATNLDTYLSDVAVTLNNLGLLHFGLNNFTIAEAEYVEALKIYRQLDSDNPFFESCVAGLLNNLGLLHSDFNNFTLAQEEYAEALRIYRKLANFNPDVYLSHVATTLNNIGTMHECQGNYQLAETEYAEVLEITNRLAADNPDAYLGDVAMTLNNMGLLHYNQDSYHLAEPKFVEALAIYRKLVASNPDVYLNYLAHVITNLGALHSAINNYQLAEVELAEALELRRKLAASNPDVYLEDVATTLNIMGVMHKNLNNCALAQREYFEALEIRRKLAASNPDVYLSYVAGVLSNLGVLYETKINDYPQAERCYREVIDICHHLCKTISQELFAETLDETISSLAAVIEAQGRTDEAAELRKTIANGE